MKKYYKYLKLIICVSLSAILLFASFGCASQEVQKGIIDDGYIPSPGGKIKMQYYIAYSESDKRSCADWVASFHDNYPNVIVEAEVSSRGKSAIQAEIAAKSCGDVFFLWDNDVYNYAKIQGVLMPLDYYVEAYDIDVSNVFSSVFNMGVVEGKLYMVMRDFAHVAMHYNRDLVNSAGLTDPIQLEREGKWDWETFRNYCTILTTEDGAEKPTVGAMLRLGYSYLYIPYLEGWGGKWFDTENKKVSFISDERVVEAANEMVDFLKSNTLKYNVVSGESVNETASQRSFSGYDTYSQIGFFDSEFPNFGSHGKSYESRSIDWDCVSMPAFPTHKVGVGATGFAVFNGTKNPDAAAALCLSLYTEDGQKAYNGQEGGSVPNIKVLAEANFWRVPWDNKDHTDMSNISDKDTKNYYPWISFPEADTYGAVESCVPPEIASIVNSYMCDILPKAVNGTRSVEDTLTLLEQKCNEKWKAIYKG